MVATVVGLVAASFGLVPDNAPAYDVVNRYLVPLSVPLLLLSSDLRRVLKETGSLLRVFVLGSIGTLAGTVAAYAVVPLHATKLGADAGWSIATALCARHIGGAVNYVSVTEALNVPAKSVAAGLAADNCVCALYFASLFALAAVADKELLRRKDSTQDVSKAATTSGSEGERTTSPIDTQTVSIAVAFSAACCFVSSRIAAALGQGGEAWTLPIVTAISVVAATAFPKRLGALEKGGNLVANVLLGFFFACVGARGSVATVMGEAPALFAYSMVQIAVHFVVLYALNAATIKAPLRDLLLASNANVGGPTTAVSMANARRWESSKVPALLVGVFGYATATFLSLALGIRVLKPWAFA